ncbi:anibiotic ABC transporter [Actinomadura craniellae]|uniref:Anibiotic ABC transporter n=1 Tax=Actinomadura craniellae TaxID=2231787 RepID=A0A365H6A3_9ACTN|nr:anibiotic ABC transporter [Actinomadura craniellae]RAY13773.1 anibiotic ABC transporter [Actinomadura craniellae]
MSSFTGTARLARLALRRDRVQLPVWVFGLGGVLAATAASVSGAYTTDAERAAYAVTAANPAAMAFNGPVLGTDLGSITMTETFTVLAVFVALMSTMAVVRHTRQNEETGRAELVGSAIVGRHAPLTAALITVAGANAALAVLVGLLLNANGLSPAGSWGIGLALGLVGVVFAGVAAVAAQLSGTSRGANGLAAAGLGLAFLLRAVGDSLGEQAPGGVTTDSAFFSWLSPIGWGHQLKPFTETNWWVLGLLAVLAGLLVALAYALTAHRDLGAGMLPDRAGPATAPRGLLRPLGLAWRLQRGAVLGWSVAMVVLGVTFGALGEEIDEMLENNPQLAEVFRQFGTDGTPADMYFGMVLGLMAIAAAGYTVQALLRMRAEESSGVLEPLLATAVSRPRWMLGHILIATAGTVLLLVLLGSGAGLSYGLIVGDVPGQVVSLAGAALAQAPGPLALAGAVVAVIGLLPGRAVALAWGALVVCVLLGQVGLLLELPQPVLDISPFTHLPPVPAAEVAVTPILSLLAAGLLLTAAGVAAFRRRDLTM